MNSNEKPSWGSEQKMLDLLNSEKNLSCVYNTFCNECATPAVKNCLCALLQDEHRLQGEIFYGMSSRGWYPVEKAEDEKITSAKLKFGTNVTV